MDGRIAVVGLGSVGSMALWRAATRFTDVVGFESQTGGHARSAVGGDTRLFRMTYRDPAPYTPLLIAARRLWSELEEETGASILCRCGGLSIGTREGDYLPKVLRTARANDTEYEWLDHDELATRYPQHRLRPDDCAIFDPNAGYLRTDRAVLAAISAARAHGASIAEHTPIEEIREEPGAVLLRSGGRSWRFERVIVAAGGWSGHLLPTQLADAVHPRRIWLTWYLAQHPELFTPQRFPIFIRIEGDRTLYGTPSTDGVTIKATLDGRSQPTPDPGLLPRELTDSEIAESNATITEFLPDLLPSIVRSDAYPDLYTKDGVPLLGVLPDRPRTVIATGCSGLGFKMAPALGDRAVAAAAGEAPQAPDALSPQRCAATVAKTREESRS